MEVLPVLGLGPSSLGFPFSHVLCFDCLVKNVILIFVIGLAGLGRWGVSCVLTYFFSKEKSKLKFTFKVLYNVLFFNFFLQWLTFILRSKSLNPLSPGFSYLCLLFCRMKYLFLFSILPIIIVFIFENIILVSLHGTFQGLSCSP